MRGIVLSEEAHIVNILPAVDITGGKSAQCFSMKFHQHATIIMSVGVSAAAWTKIIVNGCTDNAGTGATAIPFTMYKQETAGASNDVLSAKNAVAAAGYTPSANDNIFYTIEIDAAELDNLGAGYDYIQLSNTNGANSVIASAIAVLTGARYAGVASATVTA